MDPNHLEHVMAAPPSWAMNLGLAGKVFVFGALIAFLLATFLYASGKNKWGRLSLNLGVAQLLGVMGVLAWLLQARQYQFQYVFEHSDSHTSSSYLIAALWSGQQGSFLLWAVCTGIFGTLALRKAGTFERWMGVPYAIFLAALAAILAYESPFAVRLIEGKLLLPPDGGGLEPSLMNYWFLIHPPTMFLGFGSLTVLYSWAISALVNRETDSWIKAVRPWTLISATLMGTGLAMGGFWAYETLGWGGFWAWDPVENVSFVSWVWTLALAHGTFLQVARNRFRAGNLWLAGTSMVSFCYGTFLTRSGLMGSTSVHSFASMDRTALKILVGIMVLSLVAFIAVYMRFRERNTETSEVQTKTPLNLVNFYQLSVWLLMAFAVAGIVGMSMPVITQLFSSKQSTIETHIYHRITVWLFVPLALAMAIAPFLNWKGLGAKAVWKRMEFALGGSLFLVGLLLMWYKRGVPAEFQLPEGEHLNTLLKVAVPTVGTIMVLSWVCLLGITANLVRILETWRNARAGVGSFVSHIGILVALLGLIISRGLEKSQKEVLQAGKPKTVLGFETSFDQGFDKNLVRENVVPMTMKMGGKTLTANPVHWYRDPNPDAPMSVFRPDILRSPLYDIYFSLATVQMKVGTVDKLEVGKTLVVSKAEDGTQQEEISYQGLRREGEAGKAGTKFFADMVYKDKDGEIKLSPGIKLGGAGGPESIYGLAGPYFFDLKAMDAKDKSVTLDVFYRSPLYPVEIFFKPMTILVWLGIGIMTLGGFWAAWYRRKPQTPVRIETGTSELTSKETDKEKDASVATA